MYVVNKPIQTKPIIYKAVHSTIVEEKSISKTVKQRESELPPKTLTVSKKVDQKPGVFEARQQSLHK